MRAKKLYYVITFHTTADAMAMEHFCETNNIRGRLIPVPREISAGCGLAWRMEPEDFAGINHMISINGEERVLITEGFKIEIEQITRLML
jgi:hypothetical protein